MRKRGGEQKGTSGAVFLAAFALFLLLHLAASVFLPETIWGAHHPGFLAPFWIVAWIVALLLIVVPKTRDIAVTTAGRVAGWIDSKGRLGSFVLGAGALALLVLFRTRNFFLGDGMIITSVVRNPDETGRGAAGYLSLTIHKGIFGLLHGRLPGTGGECPFQTTSVLAGVGVVLLARAIAKELSEEARARALIFASIAGSGAILLFFGYVEHYSLMQAALLLYLYLSVRYLRGKGSIALPTIALAVAVALHLSAIVIAPSWLLLLVRGNMSMSRRRLLTTAIPATLIAAGGVLLLGAYMERYYRGFHLILPLLNRGDHSYPILSVHHLAFVLNEMLLLLGGVLLLPFLGGKSREREGGEEGDAPIGRFLGGAALLGILYLLLFDPEIGARDWDLMALPAFPLALFLGWFFVACRAAPGRGAAALVIGAIFLHTMPWIVLQTERNRAVAATVAMVARDPHYENQAARAPKSFGVILSREGFDDLAALFYEKAADLAEDAQNLFNLGTNKARRGEYREAIDLLERAVDMEPGYLRAYLNLARAYEESGDPGTAERVLSAMVERMPEEAEAHRGLGGYLARGERFDEAAGAYRRSLELDPSDSETWSRLAFLLGRSGDEAGAREAIERALAHDPENEAALRLKEALTPK
ncbi:MAG: tetratricopeptide repeat protein [Candidatus Eisenbacteria bacterium]